LARLISLVWDERFAATCGDWRAVIPKVVDQFLACSLLEHGFARIRWRVGLASELVAQETWVGAAGGRGSGHVISRRCRREQV
jgi:hypothetical protein